jgi:chromosome partitioning protein
MSRASVIVVGNEKGGAGKSTVAIHTATALMHAGASVGVLDLDLRQQSFSHFFASRRAWLGANDAVAPMPLEHALSADGAALAKASDEETLARFAEAFEDLSERADFLVIDTPGSDTAISRAAHGRADLIVTPMNDSFVDFDMLGVVDPVTLELKRHSLYSETVWNSRKARAATDRKTIDWVVLRNRLAATEARNRKRLDERVQALSRKVGFRVGPGLRDRVIYRELFPFGLTVADLSPTIRPVAMSLQHVAARQELRALMAALGLSGFGENDGALLAAQ